MMMSIYDEPAVVETPSVPATPATVVEPSAVEPAAPPGKGCLPGCGSCLIGCLGVILVGLLIVAIGSWYFVGRLPDLSRSVMAKTVENTPLSPAEKAAVMAQVDRVVDEYKAGRISRQQLGRMVEQLGSSPLVGLLVAYAAAEKYLAPSGLDAAEKEAGKITLQRIARGVFERRIAPEQLDPVLDRVSVKSGDGQRKFHDTVPDETLRQVLAEFTQIADRAQIPQERYEVDVGAEVRRIVDQALAAPASK